MEAKGVEVAVMPVNSLGKHVRDFLWLLRGELFLLRESWYWYLIQSSFVPVSYLFFLWLLTGQHTPGKMSFFLTGSLVMSLSFAGMLSLGQHLGYLKDLSAFEYYATLPISKITFIAAITTRGVLLTFPSVIILLLGYFLFSLVVPPLSLLILLISAYAMSGLGAFIGFWNPTSQVSSLITQILQTVIVLFAPVYFSFAVLPAPLRVVAWCWPTTYAAEALRGAVNGEPFADLWFPLAILMAFVVASLVLVPLKLDWRGDNR